MRPRGSGHRSTARRRLPVGLSNERRAAAVLMKSSAWSTASPSGPTGTQLIGRLPQDENLAQILRGSKPERRAPVTKRCRRLDLGTS